MSSLNLVPNPIVMAVEAGIFLANLVVVKKLLLEPYLKVQDERVKLTYGSQDEAEALRKANEQAAERIQSRLVAVGSEARNLREGHLAKARTRRDEILEGANSSANAIIATVRTEINRDLEEQQKNIPAMVQSLSRQLLDKIVPA